MNYRWGALIGALALIAGGQARAAVPMFLPDHDIAGTYRLSQPGKPATTWRVRYSAGAEVARARSLDGAAAGTVILLNMRSRDALIVLDQMHAVVAVPGVGAVLNRVLTGDGARFTRLGVAQVAGRACTRYLVLKRGATGSVCLTRHGVLLAGQGHDRQGAVRITALSVQNAAQPAGAFEPPAGYSQVSLPPAMLAQLLGTAG